MKRRDTIHQLPLPACGRATAYDMASPLPPPERGRRKRKIGMNEIRSTESGEQFVANYKANVEKLGFKFSDVKVLIAGHAHPDHVEGDALVKEMTGARVVVGKLEVERTKEFKPKGKEHPIDQTIDDGETFTLGGWSMTAHTMPGHTRGCRCSSHGLRISRAPAGTSWPASRSASLP